jgi:hypothetical protein
VTPQPRSFVLHVSQLHGLPERERRQPELRQYENSHGQIRRQSLIDKA